MTDPAGRGRTSVVAEMKVHDLMRWVPGVSSAETLGKVLRRLDGEELFEIPVVEEGQAVGLVSRRSLEDALGGEGELKHAIEPYVMREMVLVPSTVCRKLKKQGKTRSCTSATVSLNVAISQHSIGC